MTALLHNTHILHRPSPPPSIPLSNRFLLHALPPSRLPTISFTPMYIDSSSPAQIHMFLSDRKVTSQTDGACTCTGVSVYRCLLHSTYTFSSHLTPPLINVFTSSVSPLSFTSSTISIPTAFILLYVYMFLCMFPLNFIHSFMIFIYVYPSLIRTIPLTCIYLSHSHNSLTCIYSFT